MKIYGAVIAGGQSRRMGADDKLLLELDKEPLVERAARRLASQTSGIVINLNNSNDQIKNLDYQIVLDGTDSSDGPLAGILAVLKWLKSKQTDTDYLATAPADAPFFPSDIVKTSSAAIGDNKIAIPFYAGYPQQLFGLWSLSCIESLERYLANPDNRKVMSYIRSQNWVKVEIATAEHDPFYNVNTLPDWELAQKMFAQGVYHD